MFVVLNRLRVDTEMVRFPAGGGTTANIEAATPTAGS